MYTDPSRLRATDPGHVERNPVFAFHDAFNVDVDEVADLKERYVAERVGDVEVKQRLVETLNTFLDPIRQRRRDLLAENPSIVEDVLRTGPLAREPKPRRRSVRSERRCRSITFPRRRRRTSGRWCRALHVHAALSDLAAHIVVADAVPGVSRDPAKHVHGRVDSFVAPSLASPTPPNSRVPE
jgi:hypothetical protein